MAFNRPASLPVTQHDGIYNGQTDDRNRRAISPDGVSAISSESKTSVDNLEDGFVNKPQSKSRSWKADIIPITKRSRSTRTSSAFQRWKGKQRQPVPKLLALAVTASVAVIILASLLVYYIIHLRGLIPQSDIENTIASWGLSEYSTQSVGKLPADFSRDIIPIPCHSHNDYWRRVPLFNAVAAGCTSVEADVWLSGDDLFVGHSKKSLTKERTLGSLYIDPILSILSNRNTPSQVSAANSTTSTSSPPSPTQLNGIFETSPQTPLILLIDIKTDGASTFPAVLKHLEPLRSRGWLTYFNGTTVLPGLITVVGTGNTPFDLLVANTTYRDIFYDAPLEDLWGDDPKPIKDSKRLLLSEQYMSGNSYYASVSFQKEIGNLWHGMLTPEQVLKIRGQIAGANLRGLKARYWDTPAWPVGRRDHVWDVLMREGVGSLNVDDLEAAKERNWGG